MKNCWCTLLFCQNCLNNATLYQQGMQCENLIYIYFVPGVIDPRGYKQCTSCITKRSSVSLHKCGYWIPDRISVSFYNCGSWIPDRISVSLHNCASWIPDRISVSLYNCASWIPDRISVSMYHWFMNTWSYQGSQSRRHRVCWMVSGPWEKTV